MKVLRFSRGIAEFSEMPEPRPQPGQALLRPTLAGICQTDLELLAGYYQFQGVAGHEFVARVEEAPGSQDLVGARVVADINIGCGSCSWCRAGDARHCRARACIGIHDWPGAFAELLLAPTVNLHVLPESLSDRRAVFAEPLAAALEISQQVHLTADLRALVLGDGRLGLLAALGLRHQMPRLTLAGKHPANLEIAGRAGLRTYLMNAGNADQALADLGLFDLVVEATGSPQGAEQALLFTRPEGTVALKTTSHEPSQINLAKVVVDEITLLGSRCGDLGLALNFLQNGLVDPEPLIGSTYSFDQLPQALEQAARPGALKVLVEY